MNDEQIIYQSEQMPGVWMDVSKEEFDHTHHGRIVFAAPRPIEAPDNSQAVALSAEQERERFEAWVSASGRSHMLERDTPHLWYKDLTVAAWWTAWQARAALSAPASMSAENRPAQDDVRDAQRYRWLRNEHFPTADNPPLAQVAWKCGSNRRGSEWANLIDGNDLDAAIDAAMKEQKESGE